MATETTLNSESETLATALKSGLWQNKMAEPNPTTLVNGTKAEEEKHYKHFLARISESCGIADSFEMLAVVQQKLFLDCTLASFHAANRY